MFIEFKWCRKDDPFSDVSDPPNNQSSLHDTEAACDDDPFGDVSDPDDQFSLHDTDTTACNDDPIGDVPVSDREKRSFLRDTNAAYDTLGQITSYAAAHLGAQFRTHIFSVLIVRDTARLLRWDRSGAIVTNAIEYNKCDILTDFLFRYSKAPPAMRGKDESVSDPSFTEKAAAREALDLDETVPLVKLSIPDADNVRFFVTTTPEATPYTPPGRATRGFVAYDISQQTVVYLKDSWRIDLPDIQAEGRTYATLRGAGAQHIPHCLVSGDILSEDYHATKTQTYATNTWARCSPKHFIPHRHYRLCLHVVGRILLKYRSSYEMVSAVRDAIIGEFLQCGLGYTLNTNAITLLLSPQGCI
jgi:hypothetical protein